MIYLGVSKKSGICPICKKNYRAGSFVYHDNAKSSPNHLVHQECWDELRKSRPRKWGEKVEIRSSEELDPPF